MTRIFIIVPALNEAQVIGSVIRQVRNRYQNVVVVDDASTDETGSVSHEAGAIVLTHLVNRGQGAALKTGIEYSLKHGADIIVTFDADGQHDPADIERLIQPIRDGRADVALGSRFLAPGSNIPLLRKTILRLAVIFTRIFSHIIVTDTHNGLRAFRREAAANIRIVQDRFAHASEILDEIIRHRLRFVEVPVRIIYTDYSRSKGQGNLVSSMRILFKLFISKLMQ